MSDEQPHLPRPPVRARARMGRTIGLWALCMFSFVVVYSVFDDPEHPSKTELPTWPIAGVVFAVLLTWFVIYLMLVSRDFRRFNADNNLGIQALGRGDLKTARDTFERWTTRGRSVAVRAISRHNLGWTLMRLGELKSAVDTLAANDHTYRAGLKTASLEATSATDLALCYGLLGDLSTAERWLSEADSRNDGNAPTIAAMTAFARAVIDCRAGRANDAARALADKWPEYEAMLTGENARPLRVVRAFATATSDPRSAGVAESLLANSRPIYPGEFDFLGVGWPEMHAFLTAHQLSG